MKAVILAGGKGTRLAPYTKILPKPLMPIGDMPILEVLLRQMKRAGVDEAILTVGHLAELIRTFFQNGERLGIKIRYSYEEQPLGTAGPLSLVEDLDDTFLVANGDVLTALNFQDLVEYHRSHQAIATIASHERNIRVDLGVIQTNAQKQITGYIEKPTYDLYVSMGVYVFEPRVLDFIERNCYLDLPTLILKLIASGENVMSYPFNGYWMDLGRVADYEHAVDDFEKLKPQLLGEPTNGKDWLATVNNQVNESL
ncbi:MAG: nucleotidyltransferase family protein [Chloroflexi bacterium]|nr:MAG: nucleotidyltransferase family protein [Chloroflexota bacterium]